MTAKTRNRLELLIMPQENGGIRLRAVGVIRTVLPLAIQYGIQSHNYYLVTMCIGTLNRYYADVRIIFHRIRGVMVARLLRIQNSEGRT